MQKKVLFTSNIPVPYRVDFFNELGKYVDLTVAFERTDASNRNSEWLSKKAQNFNSVFMKGIKTGEETAFCPEIIRLIKEGHYDYIIIGIDYSLTGMLAIQYMKNHHIDYCYSLDGGLLKEESRIKYLIKKHFRSGGKIYFSPSEFADEVCIHYGADPKNIIRYPFTSIREKDIIPDLLTDDEKKEIRTRIGMGGGKRIILSVGRFSYLGGYGKGYDILISAFKQCPDNCELWIVGDEPTKEFLEIKKSEGLDGLHFVGFKQKNELMDYYKAADLFCLQTRGDVWGLVVNEAMCYGLPVITSDKCISGIELIKQGKNGYIVECENKKLLSERILSIISDDNIRMYFSKKSLEAIKFYTIENMARVYCEALKEDT